MSTASNAPRSDRTWLYLGLGFILLWGLYLAFFGPGRPGALQLEGTGLAEPADFSWKVSDLDGNRFDFARFQGKPIFLNVWATWCGPCVGELPSIARLAARTDLPNLQVVCVATDDSPFTVKAFAERQGWPRPMTVLHTSDVPRVFQTEGIPATFLIDAKGRVAASTVGSAEWDTPEVIAFLKKLGAG